MVETGMLKQIAHDQASTAARAVAGGGKRPNLDDRGVHGVGRPGGVAAVDERLKQNYRPVKGKVLGGILATEGEVRTSVVEVVLMTHIPALNNRD
ncbi:hypothetical protein [Bradyrhizobium sp.]|uniref:hypothetical protein n=1 Tax=Bradyrhizobium sp. TaxID=376 RepID=UPI003C64249B